jgi:hypothetical protein
MCRWIPSDSEASTSYSTREAVDRTRGAAATARPRTGKVSASNKVASRTGPNSVTFDANGSIPSSSSACPRIVQQLARTRDQQAKLSLGMR